MASRTENWIESHLGAVAHDLRGPLSVVSGHAQVLRRLADGSAAVEKVRASAEAILRATNRIAGVLDELCQTGRNQGAAATGEKVAVRELLEGALRGSRARLVKLEVPADLPSVTVDRQSFEHRVSLMVAALRIGRGDRPITVRVERHDGAVRVSLPDAWLELPEA
ncbi:MAG: HAMP domain-containing histidine kinase [Deltaproteobacteria bacterium]|nr:HAMP domain-containing histidine kinase [Deltaproteobacteria bacterium]